VFSNTRHSPASIPIFQLLCSELKLYAVSPDIGSAAYERARADDEKATNPGDVLRELMNDYGPCLILIDEWVAYARRLHDEGDLPAGDFETHFTFAQALTEAAKAADKCLLVISLPSSDTLGSPHVEADAVEVAVPKRVSKSCVGDSLNH